MCIRNVYSHIINKNTFHSPCFLEFISWFHGPCGLMWMNSICAKTQSCELCFAALSMYEETCLKHQMEIAFCSKSSICILWGGKKTLDFSSYSPCGSNNNDELGTSQFMVGRLFGQNFASFSWWVTVRFCSKRFQSKKIDNLTSKVFW